MLKTKTGHPTKKNFRITSYNVCYTKLLRSFSHTLSQRFSVGYNVGVEWDGETAVPGYFYSAVLGVQITDQLGGFVESFGLMPEKGDEEHLLDAGLTYLLSPNFQLDISGGLGLSDNAIVITSYSIHYTKLYEAIKPIVTSRATGITISR